MPSMRTLMANLRSLFTTGQPKHPMQGDASVAQAYMEWQKWLQESVKLSYDRRRRYKDYRSMDQDSLEVEAALDIYADDATSVDSARKTNIWVECRDNDLKLEIITLLERIRASEYIWSEARLLAKFGDSFERLIFPRNEDGTPIIGDNSPGIRQIRWVDPKYVDRVENRFSELIGFRDEDPWNLKATAEMIKRKELDSSFQDTKKVIKRDPWDLVHFRLLGKDRETMYGTSMVEGARKIWKYLELLTEVIMITRLSRSPTRRIYYVDVGERSTDEQAWKTLQFWKTRLKTRQWIDPVTGEFRSIHDPRSPGEDLFWPVRGTKSVSKVEELPGIVDVRQMADIEFMWNRLFMALKIPPAYIGFILEGGGGMGQVPVAARTLALQDLRYAKTIGRLQRDVRAGLHRIADIHLALRGIPKARFKGLYNIVITPVTTEEEIQRTELLSAKLAQSSQFMDLVDRLGANRSEVLKYVLDKIVGLTKADIRRFTREPEPELAGYPGGMPSGMTSPDLQKYQELQKQIAQQAQQNQQQAQQNQQQDQQNQQQSQQQNQQQDAQRKRRQEASDAIAANMLIEALKKNPSLFFENLDEEKQKPMFDDDPLPDHESQIDEEEDEDLS